ncbi:hypothetical protein CEUSTIGMA_g11368.t1 [Chlamydomonas eustigma]|uniref:Uncharacterized protein n=1 Tax=Chlamydomonas eustigma TaxID=1157962 RepID=A0A250XLJ7_9CHLO|nr:hypothetical protein CEUSTIGMA_g11368.t1 [Chlamydomonas eustigma]|eukprot:GAX83944.1 hypothetical protein CEUSTIGMA_g11368.t1 [Chlamydomonas eustigma]
MHVLPHFRNSSLRICCRGGIFTATMSFLLKIGRRAAVIGATAAYATSSAPVAQARAPPAILREVQPCVKTIDEEWLEATIDNQGDIVLFRPFQHSEIDAGFQELERLIPKRASSRVSDGEISDGSGTSTPTSEGSIADVIIANHGLHVAADNASVNGLDVLTLMNLTSKMLKRPGMQAEIVKAMMEDEEVRNILLRECGDLDGYLKAAGVVQVASLLPPAAAAAAAEGADAAPTILPDNASKHEDLLTKMAQALGSILGQAGHQLGRLGNWINKLWLSILNQQQRAEEAVAAAFFADCSTDSNEAARGQKRGQQGIGTEKGQKVMLQAMLVLACMVVSIIVFKRPMASFKVFTSAAGLYNIQDKIRRARHPM